MRAGSLRTCRLDFGPVGLALLLLHVAHRLGNNNEFQKPPFIHSLASDLSWRKHPVARKRQLLIQRAHLSPSRINDESNEQKSEDHGGSNSAEIEAALC